MSLDIREAALNRQTAPGHRRPLKAKPKVGPRVPRDQLPSPRFFRCEIRRCVGVRARRPAHPAMRQPRARLISSQRLSAPQAAVTPDLNPPAHRVMAAMSASAPRTVSRESYIMPPQKLPAVTLDASTGPGRMPALLGDHRSFMAGLAEGEASSAMLGLAASIIAHHDAWRITNAHGTVMANPIETFERNLQRSNLHARQLGDSARDAAQRAIEAAEAEAARLAA